MQHFNLFSKNVTGTHLDDDVIKSRKVLWLILFAVVLLLAGSEKLNHEEVTLDGVCLPQVGKVRVKKDVVGHLAFNLLASTHCLERLHAHVIV